MTKAAALSILAGAFLIGCEQAEDPATRSNGVPRNQSTMPRPRVNDPATTTPSTTADTSGLSVMYEQSLSTWKSQVTGLESQIDTLDTKLSSYQGIDKEQVQQEGRDLRQRITQLKDRVHTFSVSDSGSFESFRSDIETQLTQINDHLRSLNQKLDQTPMVDPSTTPASPADEPDLPSPEPMPQDPQETPR